MKKKKNMRKLQLSTYKSIIKVDGKLKFWMIWVIEFSINYILNTINTSEYKKILLSC
jgi:hypothetical protein